MECLGRAGTASVYLVVAYDSKLQRNVALKMMLDHRQYKDVLRERFYQEVYVVLKLRCLSVSEICDFSGSISKAKDANDLWLVMELIEGLA